MSVSRLERNGLEYPWNQALNCLYSIQRQPADCVEWYTVRVDENYKLCSGEDCLAVSFDSTHSFRALSVKKISTYLLLRNIMA